MEVKSEEREKHRSGDAQEEVKSEEREKHCNGTGNMKC